MKILAFDMGRETGVAFGDARSTPVFHTEVLGEAGDLQDARFCQALRMTARLIDKLKPDVVAIEKPIAAGVAGSEARVQFAMGYRACIFGIAKMKRVDTAEFSVFDIRDYIIGNGRLRRDAAKPKVFDTCRGFGWRVSNFDESDAGAVWHLARARLAKVSALPGLFGNDLHHSSR